MRTREPGGREWLREALAAAALAFVWALLNRAAAFFEVRPGLSFFYPAAAVTVLAGAWLRHWGVLAMVVGNLLMPWGVASGELGRPLLFALPGATWAAIVAGVPRLGATANPFARFLLVGVGGGSIVAAAMGSALLTWLAGPLSWAVFVDYLWGWWIADAVAALAFGVPLVAAVRPHLLMTQEAARHWRLWWSDIRNPAWVLVMALACGALLLAASHLGSVQVHWLVALLLPALMVAGMRGGLGAGLAANGLVAAVYVAIVLARGARGEVNTTGLSAMYGNLFVFFGFSVFGGVLGGRNLELVEIVRRQGEELARGLERTIEALAVAMEARDSGSESRLQRIVRLAELLGREMRLSRDELDTLRRAAILHNVGKVGVPERIFMKAGELSPAEVELVRSRQVELGVDILSRVEFLSPVVDIVRYQKERWDGQRDGPHAGYFGLKGEKIPIGARILSAVLAFDAMTHDRPFRRAMSREAAVAELWRCSGSQFDPQVVAAFTRVLREEWDRAVEEVAGSQA